MSSSSWNIGGTLPWKKGGSKCRKIPVSTDSCESSPAGLIHRNLDVKQVGEALQ